MSRSGEFCPRCGEPIEPAATADATADGSPGDDAARAAGSEGTAGAPAGDETHTGGPAGSRPSPDGTLCADCYFDEFDLVDAPERVEITVCSQCGAVHRGNRWVDLGAEDYTDVAIDAVTDALGVHVDAAEVSWEVAPEQVDATTIRMHCTFTGTVDGVPVTEAVTVPVKIGRQTCTRCGRIAGGAYNSVVQVRAAGDRSPTAGETDRATAIAHEVVAEMEETGDRDAFVSEVGEVAEGLNVKVSTNKIGMKVARRTTGELGGSYSDSETLVTEDEDGNEVYRVTYAVRLPAYRPGEVIDPEDGEGPVLVRSVRGNLKGVRLASGERYEASFEDDGVPEARRLGTQADATETTLVAVEDENAVQVLDPETYAAETVPRPDYLDPDAGTVPVLKSRAGLHVLPDDGAAD